MSSSPILTESWFGCHGSFGGDSTPGLWHLQGPRGEARARRRRRVLKDALSPRTRTRTRTRTRMVSETSRLGMVGYPSSPGSHPEPPRGSEEVAGELPVVRLSQCSADQVACAPSSPSEATDDAEGLRPYCTLHTDLPAGLRRAGLRPAPAWKSVPYQPSNLAPNRAIFRCCFPLAP